MGLRKPDMGLAVLESRAGTGVRPAVRGLVSGSGVWAPGAGLERVSGRRKGPAAECGSTAAREPTVKMTLDYLTSYFMRIFFLRNQ